MPTPDHYASLTTSSQKTLAAQQAANHVASCGLTPVAATVIGSALAGTDLGASDLDTLVLVAESGPRGRLSHCMRTYGQDLQLAGVEDFLWKLGTSVPYYQVWRSPFLLVDPRVGPWMGRTRPSRHALQSHARRFSRHQAHRTLQAGNEYKTYRLTLATWWLVATGTVTVPRKFLDPTQVPDDYVDYMTSALDSRLEAVELHRRAVSAAPLTVRQSYTN